MKKAIFTCILCLGIAITSSICIYAAEDFNTQSDVSVEFTQNTDPINPVDPEEPENPGPGGPGPNGPLAIIFVSDFNFGSGKIIAETDYRTITTEKPNLQVGDLRGSLTGWKVTAQISSFVDADEEVSLAGTKLHIYNARMNSVNLDNSPTPKLNVVLEPGKPDYVVKAEKGQGGGIWVTRWYPVGAQDEAYIVLEIPPGVSAEGSHNATITWALQDTP